MSLDFLRNTQPLFFDGLDKDAFEEISQCLLKHKAIKKFPSPENRLELFVDESVKGVLDFLENYSKLRYPNKVTVVCKYFTFLNTDTKTKNTILWYVDLFDWGVYSSLL